MSEIIRPEDIKFIVIIKGKPGPKVSFEFMMKVFMKVFLERINKGFKK